MAAQQFTGMPASSKTLRMASTFPLMEKSSGVTPSRFTEKDSFPQASGSAAPFNFFTAQDSGPAAPSKVFAEQSGLSEEPMRYGLSNESAKRFTHSVRAAPTPAT